MPKQKPEPGVREKALQPKGRVEIEVQDVHTGKVKKEILVENLVVNNAKAIMAHLLGGGSAVDYAMVHMAFGTGDTAAAVTDTGLEVAITPIKDLSAIDYPDSSSVRFTAVLESDEANGFPVAEAGLFSGSQGMFSRVVFGPLTKSADFRFVFRWTIFW